MLGMYKHQLQGPTALAGTDVAFLPQKKEGGASAQHKPLLNVV